MTFAVTASADSTVTVQQGDTISKIASEYNTTVDAIVAKNHLANSNVIYVGEKLTIPDGNDSTTGNNKGGANTMTTQADSSTAKSQSNTNRIFSSQNKALPLSGNTYDPQSTTTNEAKANEENSRDHAEQVAATKNTANALNNVTYSDNQTTAGGNSDGETTTNNNYSYVAYPQTNSYATGTTGSTTGNSSTVNLAASEVAANASTTVSANATYSPSEAISRAEAEVGTPYVYGGNSPSTGFDCSGLVQYAYGLPSNYRTTYQQQALGAHHYDVENAQAGDIYFWGTDTAPYHEALATGNGNYVVAPTTGETVQNSNINYYRPSYYVSMN